MPAGDDLAATTQTMAQCALGELIQVDRVQLDAIDSRVNVIVEYLLCTRPRRISAARSW